MTLEKFQEIKPQLQKELEEAILKAEAQHPGGLQAWFQALSEGPSS